MVANLKTKKNMLPESDINNAIEKQTSQPAIIKRQSLASQVNTHFRILATMKVQIKNNTGTAAKPKFNIPSPSIPWT